MVQPQKAKPLTGEADRLAKTHNILSGNPDHGKRLTPETQSNQQPRLKICVQHWIADQPVCTNNQWLKSPILMLTLTFSKSSSARLDA